MTELCLAEIDLNAIAHNIRELRRITNPNAMLMAAVKANAYGHGAVQVSKTALSSGAQWLGVARLPEAIELRRAGIDSPILILGYTPPESAKEIIDNDLRITTYSLENAGAFSDAARKFGKQIPVHIKTDTGMGRLGLLAKQADSIEEIIAISKLSGIEAEGIFTHFATSDSRDKSFAKEQLALFIDLLDKLCRRGVEFPIRHAANSAAIMEMPESHLDMVRAGISVYGLYPSDEVDQSLIALKPAMSLKTKIIHLKKVDAGFKVSYGCTYQTTQPTTIATLSVGYADGLNRLLSSRGYMLVKGQQARIVGRVCMDLTMLDVGHIPDIAIGDEVVIFGTQGNECVSVDELAKMLNTINYEIVSTITARVVRKYLNQD